MTISVQVNRVATYDGTNSADITNFLQGSGEPGTVWSVGSESAGTVVLDNRLGSMLRLQLTLDTGESVTRRTDVGTEFVFGPWSASAVATGIAEVPTKAEFDALEARVAALEVP